MSSWSKVSQLNSRLLEKLFRLSNIKSILIKRPLSISMSSSLFCILFEAQSHYFAWHAWNFWCVYIWSKILAIFSVRIRTKPKAEKGRGCDCFEGYQCFEMYLGIRTMRLSNHRNGLKIDTLTSECPTILKSTADGETDTLVWIHEWTLQARKTVM